MTQAAEIYTFEIVRHDFADPLSVAETALQQVRVETVVRDHLDPADPEALCMRYERDSNFSGEYTALVVSGTSQEKVLAVSEEVVFACRGALGAIEPPEVEVRGG